MTHTRTLTLHPYRHTILYAKGHYVVHRFEDDLIHIAAADGCVIDNVCEYLSKLAVMALRDDEHPEERMFEHLSFIYNRGNAMIDEHKYVNEKDDETHKFEILSADAMSYSLNLLVIEAALAIIMRWTLPEDVILGDPDPRIWAVVDPKIERRGL